MSGNGKLGMEAKLYYKRGGVAAGGGWNEMTDVRNLTLGLEKSEADATTRGNNGWRAIIAKLKEATVEFEMVWDPNDDGFDAIQDAFLSDNIIGLSIMDGELTSGSGLQGDFQITKFSRNEPLEETITVSVTAKVAYSDNPPVWIEQGATGTGTAP